MGVFETLMPEKISKHTQPLVPCVRGSSLGRSALSCGGLFLASWCHSPIWVTTSCRYLLQATEALIGHFSICGLPPPIGSVSLMLDLRVSTSGWVSFLFGCCLTTGFPLSLSKPASLTPQSCAPTSRFEGFIIYCCCYSYSLVKFKYMVAMTNATQIMLSFPKTI